MMMDYANGEQVEIPRGAFPFLIGYMAGAHPETAREAVAAWRRSEAEFERIHQERLRAEREKVI